MINQTHSFTSINVETSFNSNRQILDTSPQMTPPTSLELETETKNSNGVSNRLEGEESHKRKRTSNQGCESNDHPLIETTIGQNIKTLATKQRISQRKIKARQVHKQNQILIAQQQKLIHVGHEVASSLKNYSQIHPETELKPTEILTDFKLSQQEKENQAADFCLKELPLVVKQLCGELEKQKLQLIKLNSLYAEKVKSEKQKQEDLLTTFSAFENYKKETEQNHLIYQCLVTDRIRQMQEYMTSLETDNKKLKSENKTLQVLLDLQ